MGPRLIISSFSHSTKIFMNENDFDDSFSHNCCKKVAQLMKVLYDLKNSLVDRMMDIERLFLEYDKQIGEELHIGRKKIKKVKDGVFSFRKDCVDSHCSSFGSEYKAIKRNVGTLVEEKTQTLNKIKEEAKKIKLELEDAISKPLENAGLLYDCSCENLSKKAETLRKSYQKKCAIIKRETSTQVERFISEFNEHINQIMNDHDKESSIIKMSIRKSRIEAFLVKKEGFLLSKKDLIQVQSDLDAIRTYTNEIVLCFKTLLPKWKENSKNINDEIRTNIKTISNEKQKLAKLSIVESRDYEINLYGIKSAQKQAFLAHFAQLEKIDKNIMRQKQQIGRLKDRMNSEKKRIHSSLSASKIDSNRNLRQETAKRINYQKQLNPVFAGIYEDAIKMVEQSKQKCEEKMKKIFRKSNVFRTKLGTMIMIAKVGFENHQAFCSNQYKDIFQLNKNDVQVHCNNLKVPFKIIRKDILHRKRELKSILEKYQSEFVFKVKNYKDTVFQTKENNEIQIKSISHNNHQIEERKIAFYETRMKYFLEENNKSLEIRFSKIMDINKTYVVEDSLKELQKSFDVQKASYESRISGINREIQSSKVDFDSLVSKFKNEVSQYTKLRRMHDRTKKAETQEIINEFERKIQVEHIKLMNMNEALSKLYESEENDRGISLMNQYRKIHDAKNHTSDLILIHEKNLTMLHSSKDPIESVYDELNLLTAKENELRKSFEMKKNSFMILYDTFQKHYENEINSLVLLKKQISEQNQEKRREMIEENNRFDEFMQSEYLKLKKQIDLIKETKNHQIQNTQNDFNKKHCDQCKLHGQKINLIRSSISHRSSTHK